MTTTLRDTKFRAELTEPRNTDIKKENKEKEAEKQS